MTKKKQKKKIVKMIVLAILTIIVLILLFTLKSLKNEKNTIKINYYNYNGQLAPYALQFANVEKFKNQYKFDKNGVILVDYNKQGLQYSPVKISQYALALYKSYYLGQINETSFNRSFYIHANWLVNNIDYTNDFGVWRYNISNEFFNATPGWISSMAQGLAISTLIEAYSLTNNKTYLKVAEKALKSYNYDVKEGGIRSYWENGDIWYEEVATTPSSKILNGFIFSLTGPYDYYIITKDEKAKKIFELGIESLYNHINEFDAKYISYYSMLKNPNKKYNEVHINQLLWIYSITNEEKFLDYAKKFYQYEEKPFNIKTNYSNENFGPDRLMDGYFFNSYWSYTTPINISINMNNNKKINNLVLFCYSFENCPKEYTIIFNNNTQLKIKNNSNNKVNISNINYTRSDGSYTYIRFHKIKEPIESNKLIIQIDTINSAKKVALREIQIHYNNTEEINEKLSYLIKHNLNLTKKIQ